MLLTWNNFSVNPMSQCCRVKTDAHAFFFFCCFAVAGLTGVESTEAHAVALLT